MSAHEEYERHVGREFSKAGWSVSSSVRLGRRQIDHIAERRRLFRKDKRMVEAKDYSNRVGVRDVGAEFSKYQDLKDSLGVKGLVVASPAGFTKGALEFAMRHPDVELVMVGRPKRWWWALVVVVMVLVFLIVLLSQVGEI